MSKKKQKLPKYNPMAHDLHTNNAYKPKTIPNKKKNHKPKHKTAWA